MKADFRRYQRQRAGRGLRFLAAIDVALVRIVAAPLSFPLLRPPHVRSAKVERFPYRVVFLVTGEDVRVLAVAHGRRRPGYWRRRLQEP
ncbi:MAG: type II toxin-antitoxin system RelE/ParE family toxin [Labilithrix sp.]|nr:type II toxin-antitoxin system RelE/ParE family toxin [Labilithrix sp.]MCW5810969.1 type II toxin-antitoxin system RelE/ParE family toxin [Labilithrix sp.]